MAKFFSEQMQENVEVWKKNRDGFIRHCLPELRLEFDTNIDANALAGNTNAVVERQCNPGTYAYYRDLFFEAHSQYSEVGFKANLKITDDHHFEPPATIQATQFWFSLTVSWEALT
jgi:hypothetical protein